LVTQEAANARKKEMQEWEIHRKKQEKPSDLEEVRLVMQMNATISLKIQYVCSILAIIDLHQPKPAVYANTIAHCNIVLGGSHNCISYNQAYNNLAIRKKPPKNDSEKLLQNFE